MKKIFLMMIVFSLLAMVVSGCKVNQCTGCGNVNNMKVRKGAHQH